MTLKELKNSVEQVNKGLAYKLYKQSVLIGQVIANKLPDKIENACKELYPPKKTYKMSDWIKERYKKQLEKGVKR